MLILVGLSLLTFLWWKDTSNVTEWGKVLKAMSYPFHLKCCKDSRNRNTSVLTNASWSRSHCPQYGVVSNLKNTEDNDVKYFTEQLTPQQRSISINLLKTFVDTLTQNNITFFMTAGTLIGSYRHHGMTPWDDDIDLFMPDSEKSHIYDVLSKLQPHYRIMRRNPRWKFYPTSVRPFKRYGWAWPFIDMEFFTDNGTHIKGVDLRNEIYEKSEVFPLIKRPYWDLLLPSPRKPSQYLKKHFDLEKCITLGWSHKSESPTPTKTHKTIPCKRLFNFYPFVFRHLTSQNVINESLWIGDCLLRWFTHYE